MVVIARGKKIYLCKPDKTLVTQLNGVVTDSVNYNTHTKDYDVLSFVVDEYVVVDDEKVKSNGYDLLDVYMNLYLEDVGYFQMQNPSNNNDGTSETKSITAYSIEKEFEQKDWVGLKVNTGDTDSLEQLASNNLNDLGFAKEFVVLYRPDKKELSLLNLILEKMPGWSIVDDDIDPLLWNKKLRIEEDNINLYALLTSIIAPKLECIFIFDTINNRIKAVSKERLNDYTYDTNIFIGLRNLANSVNINVDEDSVYTRFNCKGDGDLTVNNWNYNDSKIIDLSYFLRDPYMSEELISKVTSWLQWRENHREQFASLSKERANINDRIYDVKYRVPNDGDDWSQWDDMTEELLYENLDYYNALLTSLQVSVDKNPQYDSNGDYIPWKKFNNQTDHDAYLELLNDGSNGYGGYYTYYEIITYIIPNIEIAINNLGLSEDEKYVYVEEYETNWSLYGIEELIGKRDDYKNKLTALKKYSKSWDELTQEEKNQYTNDETLYNSSGRSEYIKVSNYLGDENTSGTLLFHLKLLNDELKSLEEELNAIDLERSSMVDKSKMEHEIHNFTNKDIVTINTLFHDTDYTNTNILTTSVDTTLTTIDREKELFDDSVSKLSEVSQPQFNFTIGLDNLLHIPEFNGWINDFKLLNFIRVGLKDDYSVKVRMVGYSYNPCDITSDLNIEFSSMITSRSGRTDLTDILNSENNRGSKNSISIGTGNSDSDKEYLTSLLKLMVKNKIFKNAVGNITGDSVVAGSATIDEAEIKSLVSKYIKAEKIDVEQITGDEASFNKFFADYIDADVIVGDSADFKELDAYIANLKRAIIGEAEIDTGIIFNLSSANAKIDEAWISDLIANNAEIDNLNATLANIKNAIIGSSSTETGIVFNLSAANAKIDEAWISDLVAGRISVADLEAHNATADQITLISSEDGAPTIAFKDSTQQFYDSDGNVRVQIGQDGEGNFNFVVRGEDGTTALFDETGIKKEGIPENTIINEMIEDNTIEKSKLGFNIVEANEHGGVDITQIYDGNESFGVEYSSFKQTVANDIDAVVESIDKIDIGGRNLIPNSDFTNGIDGWVGYNDASLGVINDAYYGKMLRINHSNIIGSNPSRGMVYKSPVDFVHESDTTYTLSFMAKTTVNNSGSEPILFSAAVKLDNIEIAKSKTHSIVSSQWKEFTYTYTTGTITNDVVLAFWIANGPGPIHIANIKLEKGNKATDWTPAPEDFDNKINEITETISGVSSKVDQNTKSITDKVWQTDITNEIDEYDNVIGQSIRDRLTQTETDISGVKTTVSSVESELNNKADGSTVQELNTKISQVEQDAENFKVTISETYATKQNVSDSINDIEIGGRNLIPNSNFANGTYGWVGQSYTLTSLTDSNYGHVLRISSNGTSAGSTTKIYVDKNKFVHESNTTYTLSFMAKNSTGSSLAIISSVVRLANSKSYKTKTHSITTQWAKYTYTYTTGTLSNDAVLAFWLNMPGLVYITNVKLEKGTKSTDWTPAPEDVQDQIDNNVSVLSNHETRINANQSSIELQVQSLEDYKDEVSSRFTDTNTSILALDGKIENKVEQVHINNAINSIEIGGRNLILGSKDFIKNGGDLNGANNYLKSQIDSIVPSGYYICFNVPAGANGLYRGYYFTYTKLIGSLDVLKENETYTFSFYAKSNVSGISLYEKSIVESQTIISSSDMTLNTDWTKYYVTFTWTEVTKFNVCFYVKTETSSDSTVYISSMKLEKGNKATDWTPAPEDVDTNINSISTRVSELSIDLDGITQRVSATETTTTSLESRVSTAESKLTKDSLVTTIGSYYTTLGQLNNAIDGIDIGGRNLVVGTSIADVTDWYHYGWGGSWITYSKEDRIYRLNTSNGWRVAVYDMSDYVGENITISCDVLLQSISTNTEKIRISISERSDSTNTGSQTLSHHYTIDTTDTWYHYEGTITLSKPYLGFYIRGTNSDAGTGDAYVLFKNIKFEKGNKATDWTPAPEDVDASISHATSIATQTAGKFNWLVTSASSESSLTLTDTMLTAITNQFKVVGPDGSTTIISGGTMNVNNIFAQDIVASGSISGVTLHGVYGEIGGWNIDSNCLYSSYTVGEETTTVVMQNVANSTGLFSYAYVRLENCTAEVNGTSVVVTPIETGEAYIRVTIPMRSGRSDFYVYSGYIARYGDVEYPSMSWSWINPDGDEEFTWIEFASEADRITNPDGTTRLVKIDVPGPNIPTGSTDCKMFITHPMPSAKVGESYEFVFQLEQDGVVYDLSPKLSVAGVTIDKFLAVKKEVNGDVHIPFYVTGDGYLYTENAHITGNSTFSGHLLISDDTGCTTEINAEGNIIMTDSVVDYSRSPLYVQLNHQHYRTTLNAYGLSTMLDMNDNFTTPEQYTSVGPAQIAMTYADKTWWMLMNPNGSVKITGGLGVPGNNGQSWIGGKTATNCIYLDGNITQSAYHPVLRINSYSGHVWNIGGFGDTIGIYGYYASRTANGTDWETSWNMTNGNVTQNGNFTILKGGATAGYFALENGGRKVSLHVAASYRAGIWDYTNSKWMLFSEQNGSIVQTSNASIHANSGYLISTMNGNQLTMGSQNAGWCHFSSSANVPFHFNRYISVTDKVEVYQSSTYISNGTIVAGRSNSSNAQVYVQNSLHTGRLVANNSGLLGIYDDTTSGWMIFSDTSGNTCVRGESYASLRANGYAVVMGVGFTSGTTSFSPRTTSNGKSDATVVLGASGSRWVQVFSKNGSLSTSDIRDKNIYEMDDRYKKLFMKLNSILFTWNDEEDSPVHIGLGAQTTLEAAKECGITPHEIGAINHDFWDDPDDDGRCERYSMSYDEIAMLAIPFVQSHELTLTEHAAKLVNIESQLESMKVELDEAHIRIEQLEKLINM